MPNYNRVMLMGNMTRDPQLRYTPSGLAVADFGLAVNRRGRSNGEERRDEVVFVDITAWGRQAEVINEHFSKGRPIFIEGRLQLDEWTSQDGTRRSKLKVVLEQFQFITPRNAPREGGPPRQQEPPREQPQEPPPQQPAPPAEPRDAPDGPPFDDVPF